MMDESKTPPTHLGSCRYLTLYLGVLDLSIILYHEVPNPHLTIRDFFIAVGGAGWALAPPVRAAMRALAAAAEEALQVRLGFGVLRGQTAYGWDIEHAHSTAPSTTPRTLGG
jgi:hypothetical protein